MKNYLMGTIFGALFVGLSCSLGLNIVLFSLVNDYVHVGSVPKETPETPQMVAFASPPLPGAFLPGTYPGGNSQAEVPGSYYQPEPKELVTTGYVPGAPTQETPPPAPLGVPAQGVDFAFSVPTVHCVPTVPGVPTVGAQDFMVWVAPQLNQVQQQVQQSVRAGFPFPNNCPTCPTGCATICTQACPTGCPTAPQAATVILDTQLASPVMTLTNTCPGNCPTQCPTGCPSNSQGFGFVSLPAGLTSLPIPMNCPTQYPANDTTAKTNFGVVHLQLGISGQTTKATCQDAATACKAADHGVANVNRFANIALGTSTPCKSAVQGVAFDLIELATPPCEGKPCDSGLAEKLEKCEKRIAELEKKLAEKSAK